MVEFCPVVTEEMSFEILFILLALKAMKFCEKEWFEHFRKRTIQGTFPLILVEFGPVIIEEMSLKGSSISSCGGHFVWWGKMV